MSPTFRPLSFLIFFIFLSPALAAKLSQVKFQGLSQLSYNSALASTGLKIGEELDEKKLNEAILRLYAQNYFEDIQAVEEGGVLTFTLKEKPTISKITIKGVASNDRKQIEGLLNIRRGSLLDEAELRDAIKRIRLYYEARSYFDTVVSVSRKKLENTAGLELEFVVNRGENISIEQVHLSGAVKLGYYDLEPAIENKEREFMGWLWGLNDGKLKTFELANDSLRIMDEYMKRGFLDVHVSPAFLRAYMDSYTARLSYFITEGNQYRVKDTQIDDPLLSEDENKKTLAELKTQPGKIINIQAVREDVDRLRTAAADKGYAYADAYPDIQKNGTEAGVIFRVIPREKVYIRNVIIAGNDRTVDRVIRRELYLTEGNLYSRSDLAESINALRRTSYFESVDIKEERVNESQIDLIVTVKEASTGSISGGAGYRSGDGLLLNAAMSETNILGSGLKMSVNVDKSDASLEGRISVINPRLLDTYYSTGFAIYANRYRWGYYAEQNKGFSVNMGREFARYFNANVAYTLEQNDIYYLTDSLLRSGYNLGSSVKSSITPSLSFNNTDDYYLPRRGFIISSSLELAGLGALGGDQSFISSFSRFNFYQGLSEWIGWDLIYRYKLSFYKIFDRGNLPINEKIYLGGMHSMRGFQSQSLSPKNIYGDLIGGQVAMVNTAELSFPLIDRVKLRGNVFFDYGMIGSKRLSEIRRMSVGVGLEWLTPLGPLEIIIARALNNQPGDNLSSFEFSVGTRF